jgi:hypothetical protein
VNEMTPKEAAAWIDGMKSGRKHPMPRLRTEPRRRADRRPAAPVYDVPTQPEARGTHPAVLLLWVVFVAIGLYFATTRLIESEATKFSEAMDQQSEDPNSDHNKKIDKITRDAERKLQEELRRPGR